METLIDAGDHHYNYLVYVHDYYVNQYCKLFQCSVLISDTHSRHEQLGELPDGDVLIHAGDFTMARHSKPQVSFFKVTLYNKYLYDKIRNIFSIIRYLTPSVSLPVSLLKLALQL